MDSQQKSTEALETITVSYFADVYLNEEWDDMKWDIIDVLSYIPPDYGIVSTKTLAFAVDYEDEESYYFAATVVYETPTDVVVFDVFPVDVDMFLDFVNEGMWVNPNC